MEQHKPDRSQPSYEQQMYWQEFVQLKADCCYVRDYRNDLSRWVTGTATLRAVVSCSGIAAWAVWHRFAFVWATAIAISQLADALKDVFPFYKRRATLSRWCRQLDSLFVSAQRDWDDIASGNRTDRQIARMLHALRTRKQRLEARYIPDGLSRRDSLFSKAENEAFRYFAVKYGSVADKGDIDAESPDSEDNLLPG